MATEENKPQTKNNFSLDWLIGGVLTKLGDTFDRFTGRSWNPSSSLATSKLVEKLKFLLDSESQDLGRKGTFVPHIIKLKIQWDKFSTEAEEDLDKLRYELHAAAIDHINDRLYHTYAPLDIEIKTDYFTDGVKMLSSFGKFAENENDEVSINVTVPNMRVEDLLPDKKITINLGEKVENNVVDDDVFIARWFAKNKNQETNLNFTKNTRISVGRSKGNELSIDDSNVSSIHAALVLTGEKQLMVADTGSTNGTFIDGRRIAYGKAVMFEDDARLKFGTVEVTFERLATSVVEEEIEDIEASENNQIRQETQSVLETQAAIEIQDNELAQESLQPTEASINQNETELPKPDLTLNFTKRQVIKPITKETNLKSLEFEDDSGSKTEEKTETIDSSDVNLDKTQDWEI